MKTKHILSLTFALFVAFTACKKDNDPTEEPNTVEPKIEESKAIVKTDIQVDSPKDLHRTDTWPEVFYDLDTKTSSATQSGQIVFTGNFNVDLSVSDFNKYKLGVFTDVNKTLDNITYDYLKTVEITYSTKALGLESSTETGWYGYNMTTHVLATIPGKFAVIYKGETLATAEKIYIIKLNSISYKAVDESDPKNKTYIGQNNFDVKVYTKQ